MQELVGVFELLFAITASFDLFLYICIYKAGVNVKI